MTFLFDVRELDEWENAHLAVATPVPLSTLVNSGEWMNNQTGETHKGTFPIDRGTSVAVALNADIFVHSATGLEGTTEAVNMLKLMRYPNVVALEETFEELEAAGICDVVRGTKLMDLTEFA